MQRPIASFPRRVGAALAVCLLAMAVGACGDGSLPPGSYLEVAQRLAAQPPSGSKPILLAAPTATILDDTRYALAAPAFGSLLPPIQLTPGAEQRPLRRAPLLPRMLQGAPAVLLVPKLQLDATTSLLPPFVVATESRPAGPIAPFEISLPELPPALPAQLGVFAYAVDLVDLGSQRSAELEIPAAARLEFAIGLVEPRFGFDPVEFEIQACQKNACQRLFRERLDPRDEQGPGWRNRRVSLAGLAGTRQQLVFETRRLGRRAPFSFPVWGNPTLYAARPRAADQLNVILISIDTLRADHLTTYGYHRDTSPFMAERFGRQGAVFENLVASATITSPSHASMFTSLQPITHQMTEGMKALPLDVTTLAEHARHGGIETGAITENGWLSVNFGFGRGFDSFRETKSTSVMFAAGHVDVTFASARDWLRRNRDKHFFLFLHTFQVHSPYVPPARYADLFNEHDGLPLAASSASHLREMADYDREIRYTDDELRRLFEGLEALHLDERTVVIVTSDHGEAFLERGMLEHGGYLTDEMVRVPLMLWGPGIPAGRRVPTLASHVDLMPTILELLGLRGPSPSEGTSLLATIRDPANDAALATRALYSESPAVQAIGPEHSRFSFRGPAYMVRQGSRKLARYPTEDGVEYRYFDLASDPLERQDLYPTHAEQAADLRALLESNHANSAALRAAIAAEASGPAEAPRVPHLDPQQEEKLRALGYLE